VLFSGGALAHLMRVIYECVDKLTRESRARRDWHRRWGPTFGAPSRPDTAESDLRPLRTVDLPLPGHSVKVVEPTAAALRYDAATVDGNMVLGRPRSVLSEEFRTVAGSVRGSAITAASGASLPSVSSVSITSSARLRKQLLRERQEQLQRQLAQVEQMLNAAAPSTRMSIDSADWRSSDPPAAAPAAAPARPRRNPHKAKQPTLAPVSELEYNAGAEFARSVPLCAPLEGPLSNFKSRAGAGMAVPGGKLSASVGG